MPEKKRIRCQGDPFAHERALKVVVLFIFFSFRKKNALKRTREEKRKEARSLFVYGGRAHLIVLVHRNTHRGEIRRAR